jgi:hypothetical protein
MPFYIRLTATNKIEGIPMWVIESKESPRGKWRRVRFSKFFNTQAEAIKEACKLDEDGFPPDGVTLRVRQVTLK